jgi:hypothetical protein
LQPLVARFLHRFPHLHLVHSSPLRNRVLLRWCDFALRQSASCPRSSWLPVYLSLGFRRNYDSLYCNQTLPPSDASFLDENDNLLDVKHHSANETLTPLRWLSGWKRRPLGWITHLVRSLFPYESSKPGTPTSAPFFSNLKACACDGAVFVLFRCSRGLSLMLTCAHALHEFFGSAA